MAGSGASAGSGPGLLLLLGAVALPAATATGPAGAVPLHRHRAGPGRQGGGPQACRPPERGRGVAVMAQPAGPSRLPRRVLHERKGDHRPIVRSGRQGGVTAPSLRRRPVTLR